MLQDLEKERLDSRDFLSAKVREAQLADALGEAAELMRQWGTPQGGFVLGDYGQGDAIGTPPEIVTVQDLTVWLLVRGARP